MEIAIALFDRMTALDAVGPYEALSRLPGAEVRFVAAEPGPKRCDTQALALVADHALDEVPAPDVIIIPGGEGTRDVAGQELLDWIRAAHRSSRWTTSVCTGSLLLGAAGILDGLKATSHWLFLDQLREYGAEPTQEPDRIVELVRSMAGSEGASGSQLPD